MLVQLKAAGSIDAASSADDKSEMIDRDALLVYAGDFASSTGPVTVTEDQLDLLVANHNGALSKLKRLASGQVALKHCPPVQLDHSRLARDTVGRLIGDLVKKDYVREDGEKVPAVYSRLRILGKDNVERVQDGRWTHLSIGADFEAGRLEEMTITPFPAAADAAMLTKGKTQLMRKEIYCDYPDGKTKCTVEVDESTGKYYASVDGTSVGEFITKESAVEATKHKATEKIAPLPEEVSKLTDNQDHKTEHGMKLKHHFMSHHKMTDKEADEHLSKCKHYLTHHKKMTGEDADKHLSALEHDDDIKKFAMDFDDWAKGEKEEHEKARMSRLTAAKEQLTQLSSDFRASVTAARTQAGHGRILTRLSRLRAEAKITPAEIKKLDVVKLSASPQKDIDLVLGTYESREPVIMAGQIGTLKGTNLSELAQKGKTSQLEAETRANMSLLRHKDQSTTKLSDGNPEGGRTEREAPSPVSTDDDHSDHLAYFEKEYEEIHKMFSGGEHGKAKDRLKAFMAKHLAMGGGSNEYTETAAHETEKQLSALAENVDKMQAQFDQLAKLIADDK